MKNKKIILSSILSIILCVSIIAGGTFALFTNESTSNIVVSSGKVDVAATLSNLQVHSPALISNDGESIIDATEARRDVNTFANGGTAHFSGEQTILINDMTPGDSVEFDINFKNDSSVAILYRTIVSAINDTGLYSGLEIAVDGEAFTYVCATDWSTLDVGAQPDPASIHVTVTLPIGAGNVYQEKSVELAATIYAVQANTQVTNIADQDAKEIILYSAADLVLFAQSVNAGNTYEGKIVSLGANIDMAGTAYVPAADLSSFSKVTFKGTFDGKGKTISNLTVAAADPTSAVATAGLFGSLLGTVQNVTLDNAFITSTHYAGGIAGYSYGAVKNCTVKNSVITSRVTMIDGKYDNGDKVGGIVGYLAAESSDGSISGCEVDTVTINGYRDMGGIVGYAGVNSSVTDNKVNNVTLNLDKTVEHNYKNYTDDKEHDAGIIVGERVSSATITNNTGNGQQVTFATIATAEQLKAILTGFTDAGSGNGTVEITNDIVLSEAWTPVKVDGYNGAGVITINGNGHTISGLTDTLLAGGFAGNSGIVINDLTIANANITSSNDQGYGAFINCVDSMPKIELNNCHLVDSTITDTLGARVGGLIGWTAGYNDPNNGPVDTMITINGCSVTGCTITAAGSVGAIIGHAGNNPATYHTITNCVVENNILTSNDDGYRVGAIVGTANVGEVTITNCTSKGNTMLQNNKGTETPRPEGQSDLYGRFVPGTTGKLTIDGVEITN